MPMARLIAGGEFQEAVETIRRWQRHFDIDAKQPNTIVNLQFWGFHADWTRDGFILQYGKRLALCPIVS
jgi:hypothetical protein